MAEKRPNLLFVFSDQHRQCSLGSENPEIITPNFDEFCLNSFTTSNCISNSPVCVPMRGSMLTGLYAWNHRAITNDLPVDSNVESIAEVLGKAGYHTGYIGKWHLGGIPRDKPILKDDRLGFNEWKVANCNHNYAAGAAWYYDEENNFHKMEKFESIEQTDMGLDFIEKNSREEQPWFLTLSWGPPHAPYSAVPEKYLEMYDPDSITLPENGVDFESYLQSTKKSIDEKELRKWLQGYYALITLLDYQFGRLIEKLKSNGELENTIIVYTSDHGDMLGSHGFLKKQYPHNESIKVPLMVGWEGHTVKHKSDEIIGLVDLPVSLLGLMGLTFSNKKDGNDLHELFVNKNASGLDAALIYDLVPCHQSYVRDGQEWMGFYSKKYTYAMHSDKSDYVLFDNQNDPQQCNNMADNLKDVSVGCRGRLLTMLDSTGYTFRPYEKMLKDDGYTDLWNESQRHFNYPVLK